MSTPSTVLIRCEMPWQWRYADVLRPHKKSPHGQSRYRNRHSPYSLYGDFKRIYEKRFALDDDRLKRLGGGNYFDELLARIRDIRSSEKVFWRKVLEIYATSIDYDPRAESSVLFFKQVQNKMHWAAHKHTAAEVIFERADAEKENMGLTS